MQRITDHWQARLPQKLLEQVAWPIRVEEHHDPEVPASKWRGYDLQGRLCYYRHRYSQWDATLDGEDGEPMVQLLRAEEFEAWRTHYGSWIRHVQRIEGDGNETGCPHDLGFEQVDAKLIPRL